MTAKKFQQGFIAIIIGTVVSGGVLAQQEDAAELATTVSDGFTIAVVGDIIIAFPLEHMMTDPGFQDVVALTRSADVTTGNLETNIIDGRSFSGSAGGGFAAEPESAEWIKEMGFDIVARPNNHANDFGREGPIETTLHLERAGLQYAGYGDSYWSAKAACFYSSARGRVGMVAVSDHKPRAQLARGEWPGTGGLSQLRVNRYFMLPEADWESLQKLRDHFPNGTGFYARSANSSSQIDFIGNQFRKAPAGPAEAYYHYEMNQ